MSRIFLSHSSSDELAAVAVSQWLTKQGWDDVFLDLDAERGLAAGDRWQEALRKATDRCEVVVVLLSPAWVESKWCNTEFLLAKSLNKLIFGVIIEEVPFSDLPVEMTAEYQLCHLAGEGTKEAIQFNHAEADHSVEFLADGLNRLKHGLQKAGLGADHFPWPPPNEPERSPFRGLEPLEAKDAAVFFGRDVEILRGLDSLRGLRSNFRKRLFVILGASGTGKSSFLRAGLLPRLARDDREFFPLDVMRPESAAITGNRGLARSLAGAMQQLKLPSASPGSLKNKLVSDPDSLEAMLHSIQLAATERLSTKGIKSRPPTLVLPVDQAEELFTTDGAEEARTFLSLIAKVLQVASEQTGPEAVSLIVAFTIRSDRYDPLQNAPQFAELQQEVFNDLRPMPATRFAEVIMGPARRVSVGETSLVIEPELVDELVHECAAGADTLPLLGLTLERLYDDYGDDGRIVLAEYHQLGGLRKVIQNQIDSVLDRDEDKCRTQLGLLRHAFIPALVTINPENDEPMRRLTDRDKLPPESLPLLDALVERRLISQDERDGQVVLEVAHEAVLRNWGTMRRWLSEERYHLKEADALQREVEAWEKRPDDDSRLWRGERLHEAIALAGRKEYIELLSGCGEFLERSQNKEEKDRAEREGMLQEQLEAAEKLAHEQAAKKRGFRIAAVVLSLLVACSVGLAVWAWTKQLEAANEKSIAQDALLRVQKASSIAEEQTRIAENEKSIAQNALLRAQKASSIAEEQTQIAENEKSIAQDALRRAQKASSIAEEQTQIAENEKSIAQDALMRGYIKSLGQGTGELTTQEIDTLWGIAQIEEKDAHLRINFIEQVFSNDMFAEQISNRPDYVVHALVGLNLRMRDKITSIAFRVIENKETSHLSGRTAIDLLAHLYSNETIGRYARALVMQMESENDSTIVIELAEALTTLSEQLLPEQATDVAQRLAARIEPERNEFVLIHLAETMAVLGKQILPDQSPDVAQRLVAKMKSDERTTVPFLKLAEALASMDERLPRDQATEAARMLEERMKTANVANLWYNLKTFMEVLALFDERLPPGHAVEMAQPLIVCMKSTRDPDVLIELARAMAGLGEGLSPQQAAEGVRVLVSRMKSRNDTSSLKVLAEALAALDDRILPGQGTELAQPLVVGMQSEEHPDIIRELAKAMAGLGVRLPPAQALELAQSFVSRMETEEDLSAVIALGEALAALGDWIPPGQGTELAQLLVSRMETENDLNKLPAFLTAVAALDEQILSEQAVSLASRLVEEIADLSSTMFQMAKANVPHHMIDAKVTSREILREGLSVLVEQSLPEQAGELAQSFLSQMEPEKDSWSLSYLAKALAGLGEGLPPQQAADGAKMLVSRIESEKNGNSIINITEALSGLSEWLPQGQAVELAQRLLSQMEAEKNLLRFNSLGIALAGLGEGLPPQQAADGARMLVSRMESEKNGNNIIKITEALSGLSEWLPQGQAIELAQRLLSQMETEKKLLRFNSLGIALAGLGDGLLPQQAADGARMLVSRMESEKDWRNIREISEALAVLGEWLPQGQAVELTQRLLSQMESEKDLLRFKSLGIALTGLGEGLSPQQAADGARMEPEKEWMNIREIEEALAGLSERSLPELNSEIAELLKIPTIIGETRSYWLELLERINITQFHGSIWELVAQADELGLTDLDKPPVRRETKTAIP